MPELPEVTTMVRDLQRDVRGKTIARVWLDTPKIIRPLSPKTFQTRLRGATFRRFVRRGKYIVATLSPKNPQSEDLALVWHMRMTGHPLFRDETRETEEDTHFFADPRNGHIRVTFFFTDGTRLAYSDVRKFGTMHLLPFSHHRALPCRATLGPDALRYAWTGVQLGKHLRRRQRTLKQALLDQTLVAGIGNIYADEILWTARLHPRLSPKACSLAEMNRLSKSMYEVLREAVACRGSSMDDYRDLRGRKGTYTLKRRVYHRTGQPCFRCATKIARLRVGGRGTHICPQCQHEPGAQTG